MKSEIYYNYNTSNKWNGIIDYKVLALFFEIMFAILSIAKLANFSFKLTIILLFLSLPIGSVLLFCNTKKESSIDIIVNITRFYSKSKIYFKDYDNVKKVKNNFKKMYVKSCKN